MLIKNAFFLLLQIEYHLIPHSQDCVSKRIKMKLEIGETNLSRTIANKCKYDLHKLFGCTFGS